MNIVGITLTRSLVTGILWVVAASSFASAQTNSFPSSGNVGVGTTSPGATLEVAGSGSPGIPSMIVRNTWAAYSNEAEDNRPMTLMRSSSPGESMAMYVQDAATYFNYRNDETNSSIMFRMRNTDSEGGSGANASDRTVLRLYSNPNSGYAFFDGKVGINTTNPSHSLSVNGKIQAKEVIVESNWADYVFADEYKLRPLDEVAAHIAEHRRLPGMPSADEVAASGVSIGESQRLLLEKVEELTLYMLEKDKQMQQLLQRNEALEREVAVLRESLSRERAE